MLTVDKLAKSGNVNTIQDRILEYLCHAKKPARIYLRNGICLHGIVEFFDEKVLILKDKEQQLVYKSSIATII